MWPVSVSFREPEARSQILIVRSPAPLANHSFPGSTARALTQPRWPDITRMSFQGACHSGLGCWMFCMRTKLDEGKFRCAVGPFAFCPPLPRNASAVNGSPSPVISGIPSIILVRCGSNRSSSLACSLGFFRREERDPRAFACWAARPGGSSMTFSYSLFRRYLMPIRVARVNGSVSSGFAVMFCTGSEVCGIVNSVPKISRVLFIFWTSFTSISINLRQEQELLSWFCEQLAESK